MSALRLRLAFDYPPPLLPVARMCWFLLQPEHCRVVADLESIIRQRFGFSSRTRLHLFVDSCLLPPNESVQLVRDNDCVRVQQEELITENGFVNSNSPDWPSVKLKKRRRQQSADKHESQSESGHKKKRRVAGLSSEQRDDSRAETVSAANGEGLKKRKKTESDGNDNIQKKHKKKKDKSRKDQTSRDHSNRRARPESLEKVLSEPTAVIPLSKQGEGKNASNSCSSQRKARAQAMDSKSLSSESDHLSPKNPQLATVGTITKSEGKGSSAKKSPNSRNRKRPVQPNITTEMAESSSDSPSSDPETPMVKKAFALKPGTLSSVERISGLSKTGDPNAARSSSEASSDSEDSESESKPTGADTVMRGKADSEGHEATTAVLQSDQVGNSNFGQGNGRGRGRGFGGFPWRGRQQCGALRGRGRGAGIFYYNYECSQETKPGESKETVTNKHVIVEVSGFNTEWLGAYSCSLRSNLN
ncbi:uncharacterized protein LOC144491233 [Mustelus asterias]